MPTIPKVRDILTATAEWYGLDVDDLRSSRRSQAVARPRQVAMYLIKETLGMSLSRIGDVFGGRDHSTVIHSIRKVEEEMDRDPTFRSQVEAARDELRDTSAGSLIE